ARSPRDTGSPHRGRPSRNSRSPPVPPPPCARPPHPRPSVRTFRGPPRFPRSPGSPEPDRRSSHDRDHRPGDRGGHRRGAATGRPGRPAAYLPIAVVAALDTLAGGLRATLDGAFDSHVFITSFLFN